VQILSEYKEKIAKRFFTEKEHEYLNKSENPSEDFTRLWTLKESVLKKSGEGITGGLSSFCFADCLQKNSFIKFGYHFHVCRITGAYISICSDKEENEIIEVNKEDIRKYMDFVLKGEL
jgi:4'-phosphopantetheinyl transferase